jgi:hypothetical protein
VLGRVEVDQRKRVLEIGQAPLGGIIRAEPLTSPFGDRVQRGVLHELRRRPFTVDEVFGRKMRAGNELALVRCHRLGRLAPALLSELPCATPPEAAGFRRRSIDRGCRQAYARLLMDEVRVTEQEIRISGPKSVLARCATEGVAEPVPAVLLFCSGVAIGGGRAVTAIV